MVILLLDIYSNYPILNIIIVWIAWTFNFADQSVHSDYLANHNFQPFLLAFCYCVEHLQGLIKFWLSHIPFRYKCANSVKTGKIQNQVKY